MQQQFGTPPNQIWRRAARVVYDGNCQTCSISVTAITRKQAASCTTDNPQSRPPILILPLQQDQEEVFKCLQAAGLDYKTNNPNNGIDLDQRNKSPASKAAYLRTLYCHLTEGSMDAFFQSSTRY